MRHFLFLTLVLFATSSWSQNRTVYRSEADDTITVRSLAILPVFDNLRGIYSRPVETHLTTFLNNNHRWEVGEANVSGPIVTPDELDANPETVKTLASGLNADAFLATSIVKGPAGIAMKMNLYLKSDQKLIAQEDISGIQSFDVAAVQRQAEDLLQKVLKKLPYSGLILSRQGTRVTVNIGRLDGIAVDQVVSVVQIIKLNRHPKFDFLVSTEKEVIGKVKLLKVDDTLSFGRIITEKEAGAIAPNAKIAVLEDVVYPQTDTLSDSVESAGSLSERQDGKVTYGSNPIAWLPTRKPLFGMAGARVGLGQFRESVTSTSTVDAEAAYYPSVMLEGELWLTPVWSLHAGIRQGIITSKPGDISHSLSSYDFLFGYNMRLGGSLSAPKLEALFGYSMYRLLVDETSTGLSTKTYSGIKAGISGSYPLEGGSPYSLGANLLFVFQSKLKESPDITGKAENSVNNFGFFVDKALSINLKARFALDFELYSSDFSGSGPSSSSQKHTTASAGIYYLF